MPGKYVYPWLRLIPVSKDTERGRVPSALPLSTNRKPPYIFCLPASYWLLRSYKSESADPLFLYRVPTSKESTSCTSFYAFNYRLQEKIPSEDTILEDPAEERDKQCAETYSSLVSYLNSSQNIHLTNLACCSTCERLRVPQYLR